MELRTVFITNLKRYRKEIKFSQMTLAERCGTSTSYIGEIEIGKKFPSVEMIQKIAEALFTGKMPDKGNTLDKEKFEQVFIKWTIYTYCKLLSEQIFLLLTTDDKNIEYAPFHLMAQYFLSMGYSGIIYKSTVCNKGKNIVLFDKEYAHPQGDIIDIVL